MLNKIINYIKKIMAESDFTPGAGNKIEVIVPRTPDDRVELLAKYKEQNPEKYAIKFGDKTPSEAVYGAASLTPAPAPEVAPIEPVVEPTEPVVPTEPVI